MKKGTNLENEDKDQEKEHVYDLVDEDLLKGNDRHYDSAEHDPVLAQNYPKEVSCIDIILK